jgi:hypothetical protein
VNVFFEVSMMRFTFRRARPLAAGVLLLALAALAGCSDDRMKTGYVTGKLTYKGKPVPNGTVTFVPEARGVPSASGEIQPDGTYRLTTYKPHDGAVIGAHKIMIVAVQDTGGRLPEERAATPPLVVPEKYMRTATSGLSADVKEGENTFDFELKDGK